MKKTTFFTIGITLTMLVACQSSPPPQPTSELVEPTSAPPAPTATAMLVVPMAPPTAAPTPIPPAPPTAAATAKPTAPPMATAPSGTVANLLNRVNALRAEKGLAPLKLNDKLTAAAQRHSQDMANTGNIGHIGSDGSKASQRIRESGYGDGQCCENIYGGFATLDDAWEFWTQDPPSRDNLLTGYFREIGIGVATSAKGTYYTLTFGTAPGAP